MNIKKIEEIYQDPEKSARVVGLMYIESIEKGGYKRIGKGKHIHYENSSGKKLSQQTTLERINALVIPPAWNDVWIAKSPRAHIQAVGRDATGLKQYKYHSTWTEWREVLKYYRLILFANALPTIRKKIQKDILVKNLNREKCIAAVVSLIDALHIRIGNEAYAQEHQTYGITTLRDKHVEISNNIIHLHYVGKSHQEHDVTLEDKQLASIVEESKNIPGRKLFQYIDDEQKKKPLTSEEVNAYLKAISPYDFTAKDFRTWAGTVEAYKLMKNDCRDEYSEKTYKASLRKIYSCVAEQLGNTAAVTKSHYIHSDLQKMFQSGELQKHIISLGKKRTKDNMSREEQEVLEILQALFRRRFSSIKKGNISLPYAS